MRVLRTMVLLGALSTATACSGADNTEVVVPPDFAGIAVLGDSFSAGVGAGELSGRCSRSTLGWGEQLGEALGLAVVNLACAGAELSVIEEQAGGLPSGATLAAVNLGGNDIDLMGLVAACLAGPCADARTERDPLYTDLAERVEQTLGRILERGRDLELLVVSGYPRLVGEGAECEDFPSEQGRVIDEAVRELNLILETTVVGLRGSGQPVAFSAVDEAEGHSLCSTEPWFHGAARGPLLLHPTLDGHRAMADSALRAVLEHRATAD